MLENFEKSVIPIPDVYIVISSLTESLSPSSDSGPSKLSSDSIQSQLSSIASKRVYLELDEGLGQVPFGSH